jgi:ABC-2 type transport system ATP-binding protein
MPQTPAILAKGLTKRFGRFTAVDSVSFSVTPGEVFGFLGPNGSGKSTTIRMLCGILAPTAGQAWVAGHDLVTQPERVKASIGYMSQRFSLYPELTAGENFEFFAGIYGLSGSEIVSARKSLFERFGLSGRERLPAADLAGGFRQRLALACAIAHHPPVVFLDEPTSGVDPWARRSFWNSIRSLADQGISCLVTTHYMDEAEYADRIAFIYDGKLVAVDSPAALKRGYRRHIYQLTGPPPLQAMEKLQDLPAYCRLSPLGNSLRLSCSPEADAASLVRARLKGIEYTMDPAAPNLEDVFLSLVER